MSSDQLLCLLVWKLTFALQSMRATVEKHYGTSTPPIIATIAAGDNDVSIRISDQGLFPSLATLSIPLNVI